MTYYKVTYLYGLKRHRPEDIDCRPERLFVFSVFWTQFLLPLPQCSSRHTIVYLETLGSLLFEEKETGHIIGVRVF